MSIFDLFTERKSNSTNNRYHSKFNRNAVRSRNLRLESLEERALLSAVPLSASEYADLRAQYAEFDLPENMADLNVITLDLAGGDDLSTLKSAITTAGKTPQSDLIVVRTSNSANTLTYTANTDELTIDIKASQKGDITIVGLGTKNLTLDAKQYCRVISVSGQATALNLGGLTISNGKADCGGGIYNAASLVITNCKISGNSITQSTYQMSACGGGIYNGGTLTITNSRISDNTASCYGSSADSMGGGIYNTGKLTVKNSTISGNILYCSNTTASRGGGIYSSTGSSTIINCLIVENGKAAGSTGSGWFGGGIYVKSGTFTVTNSTIAQNSPSGIDLRAALTINNSIIVGSININTETGGSISGSNNLLSEYKISGSSNFVYSSSQKLFVNDKNGDYHLAAGSQAIDTGNNELAVGADGIRLASDMDGISRIINNTVDIGAYEYHIGKVPSPVLDQPTTNGQTVSVSWSSEENVSGYQLEYKLSTDSTWETQIVNGTSTTFTGERSSTYNIRVKAIGAGYYAASDYSPEVSTVLNNVPVAVDDTFICNDESFFILDVLTNDIDADNDTLSVISITQPTAGQALVFADGRLFYVPDGNVTSDSFTYTVSDGFGGTSTATVTITAPENEYPIAQNDSARVELNGHVLIDVLANDSDPDGDTLAVLSVVQPANGTAVITKDDKILYFPRTGFAGTDSFSYTVSDGRGGTAEASVNIEVIRTLWPLIVTPTEASPSLISEWETFSVELHGAEGLAETQTVCLAWDSTLFDLNTAQAADENGVSLVFGEAVIENGITTQNVVLNVENAAILDENALLASLEFLPASIDSIKAGDSADWAISVNREPLNVEVDSFVYDLNDSGSVDINDLVAFARVFGNKSTVSDQARIADFNESGTVDINDLVLFARNFGKKRPAKPTAGTVAVYVHEMKLEEMPAVSHENVNDAAMTAYLDDMN